MYSIRAERSAGWSGIAFLVLVILSTLPYGGPPPSWTASGSTLATFLTLHHQALLIGAWLGFPTTGFFLWFAVGIRAHLAHAPGLADGLPLYAIAAAISAAGIALATSALLAVMLLSAIPVDDLPAWWGFMMLLGGPILSMGSSIFVFAVANSMRRHHSASDGLAYFGYLTALGAGISTLSLFFSSGPLSGSGWLTIVCGTVLFAIWVLGTSIWLIRSTGVPATF